MIDCLECKPGRDNLLWMPAGFFDHSVKVVEHDEPLAIRQTLEGKAYLLGLA